MTALPFADRIHLRSRPGIKDNSEVVDFGDSYQQAVEVGLHPQREEWTVTWRAMTHADLLTLMAVLDSVRTVTPMTWTSPLYGTEKKYRLVKDTRQPVPLGADLWEYTATLREVFEP